MESNHDKAKIRRKDSVASCGIAALFLQSGRTTHSGFHIPLNITDEQHVKGKYEGEDWIKITKRLLLQKGKNAKEEIDQSIYPKGAAKIP
jgi:hypothetical protein